MLYVGSITPSAKRGVSILKVLILKKEYFIEKAVAVHGNKFDYSLLPDEFLSKIKVPVVCKKHGQFLVTSGNHICNARGCPTCGFEHVSSIKKDAFKKRFFEESPVIHDNKYDYSLVEYVDSATKVTIICPIHGEFQQIPASHVAGAGCFQCSRDYCGYNQRDTLETFVEKAKKVHGDLYDYSETKYISQSHKLTIRCKEHGYFSQKSNNHLNGNGCPHCTPEKLRQMFMMSVEDFSERMLNLHPTLSIDVSTYKGAHESVSVFCKIHGNFEQKARHLLLKHGCKKCANEKNRIARSKTEVEYIDKFIQVHGDKYDYSESKFSASKNKFTVICKEHGPFKTTAANHLKGKGCPLCGQWKSGFRGNKSGTFYILKVTENTCKFGISNKFEDRLKTLQYRCSFTLETMYRFDFKNGQIARDIEAEIIESNIERSVVNSLDMPSGYTETFYIKDISFVLGVVDKYKKLED